MAVAGVGAPGKGSVTHTAREVAAMMARNWPGILVVAALLVGGAFYYGSARGEARAAAPEVVRAEAFVLVDADGRERGMLGIVDGGVGLVLKDAEGRRRLALGSPSLSDPEGIRWTLTLHDQQGTYRVIVAAREDGQGCGLGLWDEKGTARLGLGAGPDGGGISLMDVAGQTRAGMGVGPKGVGISVRDEGGQERAVMGTGEGWGGIVLTDDQGRKRIALNSTGEMTAKDAEGNVTWSSTFGDPVPDMP